MSGRGSRRRAARLLCAAAAATFSRPPRASRRPLRQPSRRLRLTPPSSIRTRRSRRCRTSASTGPSSTPGTRRQPPCRRPATATAQAVRRPTASRRHSLHGRGRRPRRVGNAEDLLQRLPQAIGARGGAQGPGQRRADRPPRAAPTPICSPSCCAARAIMTRWSSRGPKRAATRCSVVLDRRSRASNIASPRSSCPGSRRPGRTRRSCATAFAVKAGDPVIAQDVIAGGVALTHGARRGGLRRGEDRRAGHRGQSPDPSRQPDPAGRSGAGRAVRHDPRQRPPPFSARHVAIIARFKRGDPFKRSKVDDLRRALIATTLVANADIQVVPVDGGRVVDLDVRAGARAVAHDRRRARLRHRPGRAGRGRAGPTAISSILKAR